MINKDEFLRKFARDLLEGNGAVFAGAGMSIPSGFVNWKDLLRDIATDLGLEIDEEHDLLAVAQFEVNRKRSRSSLDEAIIRKFAKDANFTENHRLLARLPLDTVWTTNYDTLLEKAFGDARKRFDVKHEVKQLAFRNPYSDVTIFKMHGDVSSPTDAVLTKDDYECYEVERQAFTVQLLSDLLSKKFLFLGFSFTDPNIEYTFNRLRRLLNPYRKDQSYNREHYCILKQPTPEDFADLPGTDADRERALQVAAKRFEYRVEDLKNYGIQTVAIERYPEVKEILDALNRRVRTRSVMITGAAEIFGPMGEDWMNRFCRILGQKLIETDRDIVTGVGKGISGSLMVGAEEALRRPEAGRIGQRLRLFPFPYWMPDGPATNEYYATNRSEMTSQAGVAIVISGNKLDPGSKAIIDSPGIAAEVELARKAGQFIIPVGTSGHAAHAIWSDIQKDSGTWFPNIDPNPELTNLNDSTLSPEDAVETIISLLDKLSK